MVVLTIDPARRLAQSMGIEKLDNIPRPVPGVDAAAGGSLDAMMLDMKRTFDEVVESQASPEKAQAILNNPFYVALSARSRARRSTWPWRSSASSARTRADRPLGPHRRRHPAGPVGAGLPRRPERLSGFLDGRFIRLLLAPAKGPARLMTAGVGAVTNTMAKIVGAQVLKDLQMFVAAFDTLFGGFRNRAQQTFELLQTKETAFLVVAAPEPDALREAAYFVERLDAERCRWRGWSSTGPPTPSRASRPSRRSPRPSGCSGPTARAGAHRRAAAAARRPACGWSRARRGCVSGSRPRTRTCRRSSYRRCPPTCTTSTGLRRIGELLAVTTAVGARPARAPQRSARAARSCAVAQALTVWR